jgi:putative membrane protein
MFIFGILIIVGLFFFIKYLNQNSKGETGWLLGTSPRGLDILIERYARGEIDKEEFEEKKKDLSS